ncbi:MAG: hypothetical protein EOO38_02940, partial [Cytophagaceae bacterium]
MTDSPGYIINEYGVRLPVPDSRNEFILAQVWLGKSERPKTADGAINIFLDSIYGVQTLRRSVAAIAQGNLGYSCTTNLLCTPELTELNLSSPALVARDENSRKHKYPFLAQRLTICASRQENFIALEANTTGDVEFQVGVKQAEQLVDELDGQFEDVYNRYICSSEPPDQLIHPPNKYPTAAAWLMLVAVWPGPQAAQGSS